MIAPQIIFCDEVSPRIENLQRGDVVVKILDQLEGVYVCVEKKVYNHKLLEEENLRVGASYLRLDRQSASVYKSNAAIFRGVDYAESFPCVFLESEETSKYCNAVKAYERVVATLKTDIGYAVTLALLENDEGAVEMFGQSQGRWKQVRLTFFSDETCAVFELESGIFLRHDGERFLLRNATPSFVSEKYFEFLEPQVSLLVGVLTSDKEEIIDAIVDASLFRYCHGPASYEEYDAEKSLLKGVVFGTKLVFSLKGPALRLKQFLKDCEKIDFHRYSKFDYSYTFTNIENVCKVTEERESVDVWRCTTRRNLLISITAILLCIFDLPYVVLEILDRLDICFWLPHKEKIDLIFSVVASIRKIRDAKSSNKHRKIDE